MVAANWINVLFAAFTVVIFGSLLGEWAGIEQLFGGEWCSGSATRAGNTWSLDGCGNSC